MSESEKKMTDIKDRLRRNLWEREENEKQQEKDAKLGVLFLPELFYPEDVVFLLSEIYELEGQNVRLRRKIAALEREKARLWNLVNKAEASLAGDP